MSKIISFKSDKFKKHREGQSRWLLLHCEKCANPIALYQKDGPGMLKRLYMDRIIAPKGLSNKNFICKNCNTLLGIQYVYEKENRLAYRLFAGAIGKTIIKTENLVEIKKLP